MAWRLRKKGAALPPERLPATARLADAPGPAPTGPRRELLPDGTIIEHSAAGTGFIVPADPAAGVSERTADGRQGSNGGG